MRNVVCAAAKPVVSASAAAATARRKVVILVPLRFLSLAADYSGRCNCINTAAPAHLRLSGEGRDHPLERGREPRVGGGRITCRRQLGEAMTGRGVAARIGL